MKSIQMFIVIFVIFFHRYAYSVETLICYHSDASGNVATLTDGSENTTAQYVYSPYGTVQVETGSVANSYKFAGSVGIMEELPGLYFMRARYYSADACRFLSTDPVKNIGPGWKPNLYEYVKGNPLIYNDPSGEVFAQAILVILLYPVFVDPMCDTTCGVVEPIVKDAVDWLFASTENSKNSTKSIDYAKDYYSGETDSNYYQYSRRKRPYYSENINDTENINNQIEKSLQNLSDFVNPNKKMGLDIIPGFGKLESKTEDVWWKLFSANNHANKTNSDDLVSTRVEKPGPLGAGDHRVSSYKAKAEKYFGSSSSSGKKLDPGNHSNDSWLAKRDKYYPRNN